MIKICFDGGHGLNANKGANGYYEGNRMFVLMNMCAEELGKYQGVDVKTTRKSVQDDPSLSARGKMASGFDLFLSLHSNAIGLSGSSATRGSEIYDSVTKPNRSLAQKLVNASASLMATPNRGVMTRRGLNGDYYGVMRNAIKAGCKSAMLIENGFHTNAVDAAWLSKDSNLRKLAKAFAQEIAAHYDLFIEPDEPAISAGEYYSIVNGDTFWGIAGKVYGDNMRYKELMALNPSVNPDNLQVGERIKISEGTSPVPPQPNTGNVPYMVKVTATALNIRAGAGTNYKITGVIRDKGSYTIVDKKGNWGKLKSGAGWIYLSYTKEIKSQ
jgi:N-acetylmuramoyl-L-alanine amidase/LysM repeat protein